MSNSINNINRNKAVFDDIYVEPDPRAFFSILGSLDYMIPDVAETIVRQILQARSNIHGNDATILDVGCSYGVNAALHRFPVSFASLRQRYARREMMEIDGAELIRLDRNFYAAWPEVGSARFVGFDISEPAIRYANVVGLHDAGVAADLEISDLTPEDAAVISPANVILSTGSVGYVTDKTYRKLLGAMPKDPWVISFVLRMFPYDGFIAAFKERGMVTEKLMGATFVQRRFRDEEEFEGSLSALAARGIATEGFESEGLFQAELFLSRPEADAKAAPLNDIVNVACGRSGSFAARYVHVVEDDHVRVALEV